MVRTSASTRPGLIPNGTLIKLPKTQLWHEYSLSEDLIAILLWSVTRSSYSIKQLVDGVKGRMIEPNQFWRTGNIRLLPTLTLQSSSTNLVVDLATGQPPELGSLVISDSAVIQSDRSPLFRVPARVEDLMQSRREQIKKFTPDIEILIEPASAEFLEPGSDWQFGTVQLNLDLALLPETPLSEHEYDNGYRELEGPRFMDTLATSASGDVWQDS
ncbi:hypothetical protein [Leptolyngbya sp. FACHB-261]|uniref:hypothetical protein n=1 Tax=Leptolyngbya sp. FACHB-261 TaxID=2692806 RepID=UPI00168875D4|nr:hypothetical protein [Leptolyngbya sp. FACHB-261]MBD2103811.1 hypothetical protein [Leptolyngbya sp. FACHB-261]